VLPSTVLRAGLAPLRLEFGWGEITRRGMDPLVHIHIIREATNLTTGTMIVEILGQINLPQAWRHYNACPQDALSLILRRPT
jgi:hypothetical protein